MLSESPMLVVSGLLLIMVYRLELVMTCIMTFSKNVKLEMCGVFFLLVTYLSYPRITNKNDPWITVTRIVPRGVIVGVPETDDPLQPSTSVTTPVLVEPSEDVDLVADIVNSGDVDALLHNDSEESVGEFENDYDSLSSDSDR
ncbi:unnamed protein product [Cochlearia groenlandica]